MAKKEELFFNFEAAFPVDKWRKRFVDFHLKYLLAFANREPRTPEETALHHLVVSSLEDILNNRPPLRLSSLPHENDKPLHVSIPIYWIPQRGWKVSLGSSLNMVPVREEQMNAALLLFWDKAQREKLYRCAGCFEFKIGRRNAISCSAACRKRKTRKPGSFNRKSLKTGHRVTKNTSR